MFSCSDYEKNALLTEVIITQICGQHPISCSFNPYKPSVLFVGHMQTVQKQIRRTEHSI